MADQKTTGKGSNTGKTTAPTTGANNAQKSTAPASTASVGNQTAPVQTAPPTQKSEYAAVGIGVLACQKGGKLYIIADIENEGTLSSSGKSMTLSSTQGNVNVPGVAGIKFGLNVYKPVAKA